MADFIISIAKALENILSFFDNLYQNLLNFFTAITVLTNPFLLQFTAQSTLIPYFVVPFLTLGFAVLIVKVLLDLL